MQKGQRNQNAGRKSGYSTRSRGFHGAFSIAFLA
jgi:hypothetical protein